jgi:eukaryotic-like serine/threonine-protein kinase
MSFAAGTRLGPYEIVAPLGEGGMGMVYRARDTKLNREVAIKTVLPAVASDPNRLARFGREAQVLAALNHPHIAQIFGLEEAPNTAPLLVMELVNGETLDDRIAKGPIPLNEALSIVKQIAEALEAAHEQGIIHRDLKPANIKVRPDGVVKVLDFGLAKLVEPDAAGASMRGTTVHATHEGAIVGTAAYMSPEQARGQDVDKRTDVWAFGCVLYEMLTGQRAFSGDTVTDILAGVVAREPDLARVPAAVRPLLRRALEKDSRRRLRDIGDAMTLIEVSSDRTAVEPGATAGSRASSRSWIGWAAFGVAGVAAVAVSVLHFRERAETPKPAHYQLALPEGTVPLARLSPDGRWLLIGVQGVTSRLVLRSMESGEMRDVPGTAGANSAFWSPDGRFIAFSVQGALKKVSVEGGVAETIAARGGAAGCWGDGEFVVQNGRGGISQLPESGGDSRVLTVADTEHGEIHHEAPACLPGHRFLYFRHMQERGVSGIYIGDTNLQPEKQNPKPLMVADDGPLVVKGSDPSRDRLLFMKDDTLFAQPFNADTLELSGQPVRLAGRVLAGALLFTAVDHGPLLYRVTVNATRQLTWFDRQGQPAGSQGSPIRVLRGMRIAPDGTRAAIQQFPPDAEINNDDIWLLPFAQGPAVRMTSDMSAEAAPVWSNDSHEIAFMSNRNSHWAVYKQVVGNTTAEQVSEPSPVAPTLTSWSPDGRFILLTRGTPQTRGDLWALPVVGGSQQAPQPLLATSFAETGAVFSPDGRWVAYLSDESGQVEVYVRSFVVAPDGKPSLPEASKRMVSNGARGTIRWRRDGRELLYVGANGKLMAVEVMPGATFNAQPARPLFQLPQEYLAVPAASVAIDMLPDASRFLVSMPTNQAPRNDLEVVLNWQ